jgi:glycosyltransferase involved in cell wall biosynthesis
MKSITIDTRLIDNSGIGTYIKNLVPLVIDFFDSLHFNILIDQKRKNSYSNHSFKRRNVTLIKCKSDIYSLSEQFEIYKSIPKDTSIFWSPHYVVPIFYSKIMLVTIHDVCHLAMPNSSSELSKKLYAKAMFKAATSKAAKIITDSNFSKQEIIRFTSADPETIDVIYLGVDEDRQKKYLNTYVSFNKPYIVFLGNVKPNKNLLRLLKAFSKLIDIIPHRLLIVGKKDGFIGKDLDVFDYAVSLGDRVEFTGYIDDSRLKGILHNADALVFPSLYEGFGFPPLEAMACGCPVAASSAASIPEVCGDSVLYFDPYNPDDIADKIYRIVTNPALSKSLVDSGIQKIKTFSWDISAQKTCKLIEDLLLNG